MKKQRKKQVTLVEDSPLRQFDPRTKLFLSLMLSFTIMLPIPKLLFCLTVFGLLLWWAKLLPATLRQLWRLRFVLVFLFIVDWIFVDVTLAITVGLRLILLASTFSLLVCTTTPMEMRLALEWLRLPYRYAFSLSLAFQSVDILSDEWQAIKEAQLARGVELPSFATKSAREVIRGDGDSGPMTPAFFITPSICLSSSSRSVTTRMRASGSCSSSHLAISTIRMLLPLPWVCQMTPPSRLAMRSCAALTPKNWCGRGTFFCPASKMMKLRISSSRRGLLHS